MDIGISFDLYYAGSKTRRARPFKIPFSIYYKTKIKFRIRNLVSYEKKMRT